jgi:tetratricopeptide (TPR) repeat protein
LVTAAKAAESLKDHLLLAESLMMIGYNMKKLANYPASLKAFDESIAAARLVASKDRKSLEGGATLGKGITHDEMGNLVQARQLLEEAKALSTEAGDLAGEASAASNLSALLVNHEPIKARQMLERANKLRAQMFEAAASPCERFEAKRSWAGTMTNLAGVVYTQEGMEASLPYYKRVSDPL